MELRRSSLRKINDHALVDIPDGSDIDKDDVLEDQGVTPQVEEQQFRRSTRKGGHQTIMVFG